MGHEFFNCSNCQTQLSSEDFDRGNAVQVGEKISCSQCIHEMIAPYSLKDQDAILTIMRMAKARAATLPPPPPPAPTPPPLSVHSGTRVRLATVPRSSVTTISASHGSGNGHHAGLITFLVFFTFILVLASLYFWMGGWERTAPSLAAAPPPPPLVEPAPSVRAGKSEAERHSPPPPASVPNRAREEAARVALERAREAGRAVPPNYAVQMELYRKAVAEAEGTSHLAEAQKESEDLKKREKEIIQSELTVLDSEARSAIQKEEFRRAIEVYEKARDSHSGSTWVEALMGRVRDVSAKDVWKVYIPLKDKALAARGRNAQDEIQTIRDRIAKWGLSQFANDFERALGGTGSETATPAATPSAPADIKARTPEGQAYHRLWQEAIRLAQSRDYDQAASVLEKALPGLKEADVRAEAQADLEGLQGAATLFRDILQCLSSWPKGDKISLEYLDENGNPERGNDPLIRVDRSSIEVQRGGEAYYIELNEVSARSLIALLKKKPESPRAAPILCLLEGDAQTARTLLDGPPEKISWKYWSNATKIAEARANPTSDQAKRELAARRLYFAAERDRRPVRTRGSAIEKYRSLLNDYADTAFVQRRRAQISAQRDSAKEFIFLADDFGTSGVFRPSKAKFGPCLTSEADLSSPAARNNYVEFQFYAFPEPPSRCWIYVGGCCAETFTFFYQATDLTFPHPETKQPLSVEPGSGVSLPVNHSITFLKKKHDLHGGPKEPRQWNWVSLPLPKYSTAGLKTVRILTEQKGFSVAVAVVSTTRQNAPGETELKTWYKPLPTELPEAQTLPAGNPVTSAVSAPEPRDPTLVGHWKLDDAGATAIDATGNDNTGVLVNEPQKAQGKLGGALSFDGKDRFVNIANSASLEKLQDGNYSLSAWFRPHTKPPGSGDANDAAYAIVVKAGQHEGLRYGSDQRFTLEHWLGTGGSVSISSSGVYPPGSFYHVAGVVSRTEGAVRIYVNGRMDGQANFSAGSAAHEFGAETWKFGIASPTAITRRWSADGTLQDVRFYNRALAAQDVRALAGTAAAGPPITVTLTSPSSNEHFEANSSLTLTAHVVGGERVAKVEFLQGLYVIGTSSSSPYVFSWHKVPVGVYSLCARVVDRAGGTVTSPPVNIRVGKPEFYRGLKLGGAALTVEGQAWEGKEARNVVVKGDPGESGDISLEPAVDAVRALLLKSWVSCKDVPVVTINPAPSGPYQIYIYVVSTGDQTYDLSLKGKTCLSGHSSGPSGRWEKLGPFLIDVGDGIIDVTALGGKVNFCGVELWRLPR